jgi:multiple sugar transport system permease protein
LKTTALKVPLFTKARDYLRDPLKKKIALNSLKEILITVLKYSILIGVSYVIVSPVIGMFVNSISSDADAYNPMMFILPKYPTLERYRLAILRLDYWETLTKTMLYSVTVTFLQLFICSMVGYGFARFKFPLKKLWFGCVIFTIIIPTHSIMLPLYVYFKQFDIFGIVSSLQGKTGLMGTVIPMYVLSLFACGLRSGLFIYIFNQFFRGLPKEIEEAAFVDGANMFYTYFRIMLVNAMPAVITVTVFSFVWQFNDVFYAKLFLMPDTTVISKRIASLQKFIANEDNILSITLQELYRDAGAILVIAPVVIVYLLLQKNFIEGVERSGIVG